jgi:hypothetical protein
MGPLKKTTTKLWHKKMKANVLKAMELNNEN